jgi:hypothetical protein
MLQFVYTGYPILRYILSTTSSISDSICYNYDAIKPLLPRNRSQYPFTDPPPPLNVVRELLVQRLQSQATHQCSCSPLSSARASVVLCLPTNFNSFNHHHTMPWAIPNQLHPPSLLDTRSRPVGRIFSLNTIAPFLFSSSASPSYFHLAALISNPTELYIDHLSHDTNAGREPPRSFPQRALYDNRIHPAAEPQLNCHRPLPTYNLLSVLHVQSHTSDHHTLQLEHRGGHTAHADETVAKHEVRDIEAEVAAQLG